MTATKVPPRYRMVPGHPDGFGDGKPQWRLPDDVLAMRPAARNREVWAVLAAVSQHEHALRFREELKDRNPAATLKEHCERWGYSDRRMGQVLRGDSLMRHDDLVFVVRSLGPAAVPEPSDLVSAIDFGAQTAAASAGLPQNGPLAVVSREAVMVMDALGAPGSVTVDRALTREEIDGLAQNRRVAPPLIERAASRLRQRPGLEGTDLADLYGDESLRSQERLWKPAGGDNVVDVDLARHEAPDAVARGSVDNDGLVVTVWLKHDWTAKVHDAGHAEIDGWFVADTAVPVDGKPTRARVLDLIPHGGDTTQREDGTYVADHEYRTREVTITWDSGRPSIGRAPEDPSRP